MRDTDGFDRLPPRERLAHMSVGVCAVVGRVVVDSAAADDASAAADDASAAAGRAAAGADRDHVPAAASDSASVEVLMIRRAQGTTKGGYWTPITGKLDPGESAAEAAVRETQEEVGLSIRPLRTVWGCPTSDERFWLTWWLCAQRPLASARPPATSVVPAAPGSELSAAGSEPSPAQAVDATLTLALDEVDDARWLAPADVARGAVAPMFDDTTLFFREAATAITDTLLAQHRAPRPQL